MTQTHTSVVQASKTLLADAQKQYHLLLTGQAARVLVDQNGERVEFNRANSADLYAYILQLQAALGVGCGDTAAVNTRLGPAGFIF